MEGKGRVGEIFGLFLIFCSVFLLVCLLSHDPRDPSLSHYVTNPQEVRNLGGLVGAVLSDLLLQIFGLCSYPLSVLLGMTGGMIIAGIKPRFVSSRLWGVVLAFGFMLMIFGLWGHGSGILGEMLATLSLRYLNATGSWLLGFFGFSVAFLMITGVSLSELFASVGRLAKRGTRLPRDLRKGKTDERREAVRKPRIVAAEKTESPIKGQAEQYAESGGWRLPPFELLEGGGREKVTLSERQLWTTAQLLENKLRDFGVEGKVVEVRPGPVVTVYEFEPAPGVKISRIVNLEDDLALALSAYSVRIEAPIPGKSVVGIEVSNPVRETVYLKDILISEAFQRSPSKLTLALGKDIEGRPFAMDLTKMPHLLVAGSTGSGKSVSMNCMIMSIIFRATPDEVRFLLIDPKMLELSAYEDMPHLLLPVVTDPREAASALRWVVREMEGRYSLMASKGTKHIERYNQRIFREGGEKPLPYIVVMIDELADLMITSRREVEESITRLAQMARAAGIHLILATQRPSVDVITGTIKANFPARISFQVSSKVDSRTILDTTGAEHLLGQGDMLFLPPGSSRLKRIHGAYVSEEEIKRVADFWKAQGRPEYNMEILKEESTPQEGMPDYDDPKYEEAVNYVIQTGQASVSALQRRFKIGYNRAARLIERMEREGIVGPSDGVRPREVLIKRK